MAAIVSIDGREVMLNEFLDANTVTVHLGANEVTLNEDTTVVGDFVETTNDTYAAQDILSTASWTATNDAGVTTFTPTADGGVVTFSFDGTEFDARTYYVTYNDGQDDRLLWAEDLDPPLLASTVQTVSVTVRLRARNHTV